MQAGVSVVIPVYNSESTLPGLVPEIAGVLRNCSCPCEIILVNDGSRDGSWLAILDLCAADHRVRGINLMRNYGQHNALLCGIRACKFDVAVTMDDDGQHPPQEVPRLLEKLGEGHDVVYGVPLKLQHGLWRDLASLVTKMALQATIGSEVAGKVSAFRAFRTPIREAFAGCRSPFVSLDVLLTWGATGFSSVAVNHRPRQVGRSNYTFRMLVRHAVNMMTGYSTLPLQLASYVGFAMTLFGLGVLAVVVGRYFLEGRAVPGFAFLASIVALFSGAQLFAIGIIGEYLARMHFSMMERPTYAVREEVAGGGAGDGV